MFNQNDTFFIADCHLDGSRPGLSALFTQFLDAITGAGELWILGDFVEYWLGDDAGNNDLNPVFDALAARQAAGMCIHLMHGNRDFLIGQDFGDRIGAAVHTDDEQLIQLGDESVLLMHGDTLCTDDTDYQQLRRMLRSNDWQQNFLSLSVDERQETAKSLRDESRTATSGKSQGIMDVNESAVHDALTRTGVHTIIHGHTHRPNTHTKAVNGHNVTRIVVGDWHDDHAMVAHSTGTNVRLRRFPF